MPCWGACDLGSPPLGGARSLDGTAALPLGLDVALGQAPAGRTLSRRAEDCPVPGKELGTTWVGWAGARWQQLNVNLSSLLFCFPNTHVNSRSFGWGASPCPCPQPFRESRARVGRTKHLEAPGLGSEGSWISLLEGNFSRHCIRHS